MRLALSPSGGSLVSLMEFWSKEMGRGRSSDGGGSADRNSLQGQGCGAAGWLEGLLMNLLPVE